MRSTQAILLGIAIGFSFAILPSSCGKSTVGTACSVNCNGCCDTSGSCLSGQTTEMCGEKGASCEDCAAGEFCARVNPSSDRGGRCTSRGTDGGGGANGATGGGTGNTGGGIGSTGGAGGGQTGNCDASNCANGCCTQAGVCITDTSPARCGSAGAVCAQCTTGNTCNAGLCTPCNGCIDLTTGNCEPGISAGSCGKAGGFCRACDQATGQTCQGGACFGGDVCNSGSCLGCCDGNTCIAQSAYTNAQCGQGPLGAACVSCFGGQTCDALDAGACTGTGAGGGTGGAGGGSGFPTLDICTLEFNDPCVANRCCQPLASGFGGASNCVKHGTKCDLGISGTCDGPTQTCR